MNKTLKIYNEFGIKPKNNYVSAGMDFFVPYIDMNNDEEYFNKIHEAWKKSYNIDDETIKSIKDIFNIFIEFPDDEHDHSDQLYNLIQLFFALKSKALNSAKENDIYYAISMFINEYAVFDDNGTAGIAMKSGDSIVINSGIKIALPNGYAGIMFNKSGKGNAGWDTRACVIDEDYSGFVHLSMAYTKDVNYNSTNNAIFCGDKLVQMVILPVLHLIPEEISKDDYDDLMKDSERGDKRFGSSDVKH